jgi:hypothetical protein
MITTAQERTVAAGRDALGHDRRGRIFRIQVRMKLFILDHRLILRKISALSPADREAVKNSLLSLCRLEAIEADQET